MRIPIFPLQVVLFPGASLPLHIFEPRYKDMVRACQAAGTGFGVVHAEREQLAVTGCMASIVATLQKYEDGRVDILTRGGHRFHIVALDESAPYLQAEVNFLPDDFEPAPRALREQAAAKHFEFLELSGAGVEAMSLIQLDQPVSFQLADALPIPFIQQQSLLSTDSDTQRTMMLLQIYDELINDLRMHGTEPGKRSRMVH
jgi:ATP-dependent Lon protease